MQTSENFVSTTKLQNKSQTFVTQKFKRNSKFKWNSNSNSWQFLSSLKEGRGQCFDSLLLFKNMWKPANAVLFHRSTEAAFCTGTTRPSRNKNFAIWMIFSNINLRSEKLLPRQTVKKKFWLTLSLQNPYRRKKN